MEGVTGMMARLSHMPRVAAGGPAMYRTRVFFFDRVRALRLGPGCILQRAYKE